MAYAINNTKFVAGIKTVGDTFLREYYRVAVVDENSDDGNVQPNGSMGNKNIRPPDSDTIPVQSIIRLWTG